LDGVPLLAVTVGMLALAEEHLAHGADLRGVVKVTRDARLTWSEFRRVLPTFLRSSVIGTGIGIVPGLGPTVASFASYASPHVSLDRVIASGKGS
jgi:putative tricarboxylic transport membrane protein